MENSNLISRKTLLYKTKYSDRIDYYNRLSDQVIDFCNEHNIGYHIKKGTITEKALSI